MSVKDDGRGMSSSALSKLFDPFYSTKFPGRGLGIASVAGIVQNRHGAVKLESEIDKGAAITIYLPLDKKRTASLIKTKLDKTGKKQTILIVEDEESVRLVSEEILTNAGFK